MDLMEYQAKELFAKFDIPGPKWLVIDDPATLRDLAVEYPVMVKAQVQTGGRGKAGGIKPADNPATLETACRSILGMNINGRQVERVIITPKVETAMEWYLAIVLDRIAKCPGVIFSRNGGVDIEETAKTDQGKIIKLPIDPVIGLKAYAAAYLADKAGIDPKHLPPLRSLLDRLYRLFLKADCILAEINPLAVTPGGELLALDAKVTIDDSGLFRHPDILALRDELEPNPLIREGRKAGFLFIPCDPDGAVSVVSNGSGMIMSCIDVLANNGLTVCSAIDLGGGATFERVREATRVALSDPKAKALFINIFGGITRCDEVANGVKEYMEAQGSEKLVVMRFEGTNMEKGLQILESMKRDNVVFADGLHQGVEILVKRRAAV
ncbi:MAG: acetate--CoA ligase family protein [Planctomycetes bacterium]|nr:acetate--CoA ligase family protein [Planctomycetota bacterium]